MRDGTGRVYGCAVVRWGLPSYSVLNEQLMLPESLRSVTEPLPRDIMPPIKEKINKVAPEWRPGASPADVGPVTEKGPTPITTEWGDRPATPELEIDDRVVYDPFLDTYPILDIEVEAVDKEGEEGAEVVMNSAPEGEGKVPAERASGVADVTKGAPDADREEIRARYAALKAKLFKRLVKVIKRGQGANQNAAERTADRPDRK